MMTHSVASVGPGKMDTTLMCMLCNRRNY